MTKLNIRLQNHGVKNHPLWWIVIANHKDNIRGRYIQKVGIWSPREGHQYLQRQIVLNIPRIKYWIANGAIPTFKVHKFLSLWGMMPAPWYFQKTQEQLAALKTPYEQMSDKQKRKQDRKVKRKQRLQQERGLDAVNWNKKYSRFHFYKGYKYKLQQLTRIAQRQNQILRQMLLSQDVEKARKMRQLSKQQLNMTERYAQLKEKLNKAKSELHFLEQNYKSSHHLQKIKVMQQINKVAIHIRQLQMKRAQFILPERAPEIGTQGNQYVSQSYIRKLTQYQLINKKVQKMQQQMQKFQQLSRPITLEEYAQFLKQSSPQLSPQQALQISQQDFYQRTLQGNPLTLMEVIVQSQKDDKWNFLFDLFYFQEQAEELEDGYQQGEQKFLGKKDPDLNINSFIKKTIDHTQDAWFANSRPVNPFPDFKTYNPLQYYQPIGELDLKMAKYDPMQSYDQLQKYYEKTGKKNKQPITKKFIKSHQGNVKVSVPANQQEGFKEQKEGRLQKAVQFKEVR